MNLVEGGKDADGTPLYVAVADYEGGSFPGKASPNFEGCNFGYGGKVCQGSLRRSKSRWTGTDVLCAGSQEVNVRDYRVLTHA